MDPIEVLSRTLKPSILTPFPCAKFSVAIPPIDSNARINCRVENKRKLSMCQRRDLQTANSTLEAVWVYIPWTAAKLAGDLRVFVPKLHNPIQAQRLVLFGIEPKMMKAAHPVASTTKGVF